MQRYFTNTLPNETLHLVFARCPLFLGLRSQMAKHDHQKKIVHGRILCAHPVETIFEKIRLR